MSDYLSLVLSRGLKHSEYSGVIVRQLEHTGLLNNVSRP